MRATGRTVRGIFGFCVLALTLFLAACGGEQEGGTLALFAGEIGVLGSGYADGVGTAARFDGPRSVAADGAGNVYVADTLNFVIRRITPGGMVTTLAGTAGVSGSADGTGAAASFGQVYGVGTDSNGNVYVADSTNNTIRRITSAGVVTTLAGTAGVSGSADGNGATASFDYPLGIATDSAGNVYVADTGNNTIRKITPAGVVTTFAGTAGVRGWADGTGAAALFDFPDGVAADSAGNVYVADAMNQMIRKITPAGVVTTLAGGAAGSTDSDGFAAQFNYPAAIAADGAGNVYVADYNNCTIRKVTPLQVMSMGNPTTIGVVSTVVGVAGQTTFAPGPLPGQLGIPTGVAVSGTSLYVTLYNGVAVVRNRP